MPTLCTATLPVYYGIMLARLAALLSASRIHPDTGVQYARTIAIA
jgi:hypothetical protein